jgi:hypothetical protein
MWKNENVKRASAEECEEEKRERRGMMVVVRVVYKRR